MKPHLRILAVFFLLLFSPFCLADGHRNVHYYTGTGTIRWDLLTHLVYLRAGVVDGSGAFVPHSPGSVDLIRRLKREADERGKIFMVSYAGSYAQFKPVLENVTKRDAYAQAVVNFALAENLDGIDFDVEYPSNSTEFARLSEFLEVVRTKLGAKPLLTAAVSGWQVQIHASTVNDSLDWIQTMTYHWRTAAQSGQDLDRWTGAGVHRSKINLGVPFSADSNDDILPYDVHYHSVIGHLSPFNPAVNDVYVPAWQGTFNYVGVNLQKDKARVAANHGGGTMVWHHTSDVTDIPRSLAVSLNDEILRYTSVIDGFELPVGSSSSHLYMGGQPIEGTYQRTSGWTGALTTLSFNGLQWENRSIISKPHPQGYAFPAGAKIQFDFKVLAGTHSNASFYLRLFDGSGNWIQSGYHSALSYGGWRRAEYGRSSFSANASFDYDDVRQYQILVQLNSASSAFTSQVVFDNMLMIGPDPARRPVEDSDVDGFSNELERHMGTSQLNGNSKPAAEFADLHIWLKLDETEGTTAREENRLVHGKVYGGTWGAGNKDNALQLDGVDDGIEMDSTAAIVGTGNFTVSAWVKTSDTDGGTIWQQKSHSPGLTPGFSAVYVKADGKLRYYLYNGGFQFDITSPQAVNDGQWHHISVVRNGTNGYLYVDGTLVAQGSGPIKELMPHPVVLGYAAGASNLKLNGWLDDVRIYRRALDSAELGSLSNYVSNQVSDSTFSIPESTPVGTVIADFGTGSSDYQILSGNEAGYFQLNANTGELILDYCLDFDTALTNSYKLYIKSSGGSTPSSPVSYALVNIQVTDVANDTHSGWSTAVDCGSIAIVKRTLPLEGNGSTQVDLSSLNGDMAFEFIVSAKDFGQTWSRLLFANNSSLCIESGGNSQVMGLNHALHGASHATAVSGQSIASPYGAVHHLVFNANAGTQITSIYLNGIKVGTLPRYYDMADANALLGSPEIRNDNAPGVLAFAAYNSELPSAEVLDHYHAWHNHRPVDSDADGLTDAWEIAQYSDISTHTANADPDFDGTNLFAEMAFGGKAMIPEGQNSFYHFEKKQVGGQEVMVYQYRRLKEHLSHRLNYQLLMSSDMNNWFPYTGKPYSVSTAPDGTTEWVTYHLPIPSGTDHYFYRCKAVAY